MSKLAVFSMLYVGPICEAVKFLNIPTEASRSASWPWAFLGAEPGNEGIHNTQEPGGAQVYKTIASN